jgi:phage tail-like protein
MSERVDPVVKFRFSVKIKDAVVGWFTDCSGLTVERETLPQSEGGVNDYVHQLPGRVKQTKVTLKRGLADNALWDWFEKGLYDGKVERNNVTIILYNSDLSKKKQWDLENAYPVKWTGPDFQSESNQAAVESLEIVHHGLTMRDWAAA